ncbi:unnamed protein product [Diamesa hyperborea]
MSNRKSVVKFLMILIVMFNVFKASKADELFPLSIIHLNDMHARFEETNMLSNTCKATDQCIGGYARIVTKIKELLNERKNPLYLNAGDNYQGTLWYNVHRWNVTSYLLNLLPADVMTIGNHEFDDGIDGVVPFLDTINSPVVIANVDDTNEPRFQNKYKKSIVITKYGRKIGIVGVMIADTPNTGGMKLLPEVESVRQEAAKLKAEGLNIIIVLSHCGLEIDRDIAQFGGSDIDIIVGGHSHSFLFSGENPPGPDRVVDNYPIVEIQQNGHKVLIVQASAYTKYLGDITLYFNDDGIIQEYTGKPIFMEHSIVPDAAIIEELKPWKEPIDRLGNKFIANVKYDLSSRGCYSNECKMGNLITDAFAYAFLNDLNNEQGAWTGAAISMHLPGGIRAGLKRGNVTYGDLVTTTPFGNILVSVELQGKHIREALEFSVSKRDALIVLQMSGLKVVYNLEKEMNNRIVSLHVLCRICDVPKYEPINDEQWYRVVMPRYLADGGDNFIMISDNARNTKIGPRDIDALNDYMEKFTPLTIPAAEGRITFLN